ncbi:hypothetical protein FACUT_7701 [Fusarium acutatum]|uniref:BZIP domain-containing protein n=1 Tax=Fusarium acutatum TaxID=78861 RepID=A0A8H4NEL5_9HYPO|nr:hypothetical protein FACUT_7701 [Fusarium acutatum]
MGTVYAAYKQDPLGDDMQAYDTYAPAPDVNSMSQNPSGMNMYGTLPQFHWGQWWSPTEDASFAESTNVTAPTLFAQEESRYNYTYDPETSTQWDSPATSTQSYPVPSPDTDPSGLDIPVGDTESRRGSLSTGSEKRKCKQNNAKPTASKSTGRAPTQAMKQDAAPEKANSRGSQGKPAFRPTEQSSPQLDERLDEYSKKIQERNRVASNKFRIKKREDAKRLQADEENMKQANHKLLSSVSDLTQQVYELKMKLLQHTNCDCYLIQEYIVNEANRIRETITPNPNIMIRYDTTMT